MNQMYACDAPYVHNQPKSVMHDFDLLLGSPDAFVCETDNGHQRANG